MATVGKLTQQGELKLSGNIDTRLPLVTEGLVAHFPMDGSTKAEKNNNIINYSTWIVGSSGSQTGFSQNGDDNTIVSDVDPFGQQVPIWNALDNDTTSTADGGWNGTNFSIDNTKLYRFSVWIKRKVLGNGSYYLGTHGYGSTNGVYTGATGGTLNTNPYFSAGGWGWGLDEWILFVGHVHPHNNVISGSHQDTGIYKAFNKTKISTSSGDFRWHPSTTSSHHRSYLYYSSIVGTHQQFCYPRVDLCDGTEPTIEDLVNGEGNILNPTVDSNVIKNQDGISITEATTNGVPLTSLAHVNPAYKVEGVYSPGWNTSLHRGAIAQNSGWGNGYNSGVTDSANVYHAHWIYDKEHNDICMFFRDEPSPINGSQPSWLGISRDMGLASTYGITDNMYITISWLQKTSKLSKGAEVGLYHRQESNGAMGFEDDIKIGYNTKVNIWERVSTEVHTGTNWNLSNNFYIYVYGTAGGTGKVWVKDVQLELNRRYHSDFLIGSKAKSSLQYNFPRFTTGTIMGSFIPDTSFNNAALYTYTPNQASLIGIHDSVKGGNVYYRYYNPSGASNPFLDQDGYYGGLHYHASNEYNSNERLYYIIKKSDTSMTIQIYQNGWKNIHTSVVPSDSGIDKLTFGTTTLWSGKHSDLSIYNRILSTEEIEKNIKGTHSISTNGLISNNGIKSHIKVPDGANYFPLDSDGRDFHKSIIPTKDEYIVYENSSHVGVYIGSGTTNLLSGNFDTTFDSYSDGDQIFTNQLGNGGYVGVSSDRGYGNSTKSLKVILGDGNRTYRSLAVSSGNYVTVSAMVYSETPGPILSIEANGGNYTWGIVSSGNSHKGTGWELLYRSTTSTLTSNTTIYFFLYPSHTNPIYMDNVLLEYNRFPTEYVYTSRGQSSLHLPYNIIDCKQDFTIYGWWYPKVYGDGLYRPCLTRNPTDSNSTYNRILIMNGPSSSNSTLALWAGSNGSSESTITNSTTLPIVNEWNFFCVKRDGINLYLYVGNSSGISSQGGAAAYRLDADETGQVWQIGEYSNSESDAYHRDYVFYQGALTNDEIEEIFKTKMKATSDGLYIQNGISSNESL